MSMRSTRHQSDFVSLLRELRAPLEAARDRLHEEILGYPTPIPRCDAQFNHLIERRGEVQKDLDRLEALQGKPSGAAEIEAFLRSSRQIDEDLRRKLRPVLTQGVKEGI